MIGIELNCALVVRQLPVELADGYHAFSPILRKRLGSWGQSVADDPLIQLLTCLNTKKIQLMRVLCKKFVTFPAKIRQK